MLNCHCDTIMAYDKNGRTAVCPEMSDEGLEESGSLQKRLGAKTCCANP